VNKDNTVYIRHIYDAIKRLEEYLKGIDYESFLNNNLLQAGVIRELEIIGEASKKLGNDFKKQYPEIPWKNIAGMRDKLIHDYFGVDLDAVWETVERDIPELRNNLKQIIGNENQMG